MTIRQPIVVLMGHIDHGKSSILEKVRGISITKGEPGLITQSIKSYNIPFSVIQAYCGQLLNTLKTTITIPGLLFLDSPGHAAFNNMRKIGGNLADIAILVVDAREGIKDQTKECIAILKQYKTPFIIVLNKIDLIPGWHSHPKVRVLASIASQSSAAEQEMEKILYTLVGKLAEEGLNAERFDRVDDFTKQIAIVPASAKTGEGLPELLMVITGLAQRFLEKALTTEESGAGKATILEVTEEEGIGTALDIVLYEGTIRVNDEIIFATMNQPVETKVRALFECDYRKRKLVAKKEVHAATGIKLVAPNIKDAIGGMPLLVMGNKREEIRKEVEEEVSSVIRETGTAGIILKADTIGSLEALAGLVKEANIPVSRCSIGDVTKKDVAEAKAEKNAINRVILGFNVKQYGEEREIKQITHEVIYKIIEEYEAWKKEQIKKTEAKEIEGMHRPFRIKVLRGFIFRQSNPAVVGVLVQSGTLGVETPLMKSDGSKVSSVKTVQKEGKNVPSAEKDCEVAVAIPHITVGRQIKEEDILYSDVSETEFKKLKILKKYLKPHERETLKEIAEIKRRQNPLWGV